VRRALTSIVVVLAVANCASTSRFRVASLPPGWERVRHSGESVTFHHTEGGSIAVSRTCGQEADFTLDWLTNHMLIGVTDRRERSRERVTLDGRAALRTRLQGTLDGVRMGFDIVVLKKDGCAYDLVLVAEPAQLEQRRAAFERFVAGFQGSAS
jgi:hypothetical protein